MVTQNTLRTHEGKQFFFANLQLLSILTNTLNRSNYSFHSTRLQLFKLQSNKSNIHLTLQSKIKVFELSQDVLPIIYTETS